MAKTLSVLFMGLPGGGKSTILTALAGRQLFESGDSFPNQTIMVGEANPFKIQNFYQMRLFSSDKVRMNVLSVQNTFDITAVIEHIDVILWITSIDEAFKQPAESKAIVYVCDVIAKEATLGHLVKLGIVVSKCSEIMPNTEQKPVQNQLTNGSKLFSLNIINFGLTSADKVSEPIARVLQKRIRYFCYNAEGVISGKKGVPNSDFEVRWAVHLPEDNIRLLTEQFISYLSKQTTSFEGMPRFALYSKMIETIPHETIRAMIITLTNNKNTQVKLHVVDCLAPIIDKNTLLSLFSDDSLLVAMYIVYFLRSRLSNVNSGSNIQQEMLLWKKLYLGSVYSAQVPKRPLIWISRDYVATTFPFHTAKQSITAPSVPNTVSLKTIVYKLDNDLFITPTLKYSTNFAKLVEAERSALYDDDVNISLIINDVASGTLNSLIQPLVLF